MEGTAKRLATGLENQGGVTPGGSTPLPSAQTVARWFNSTPLIPVAWLVLSVSRT